MKVWEKILYELKLKGKITLENYNELVTKDFQDGLKNLIAAGVLLDENDAYKYYFYAMKSHSLEDVLISEGMLSPFELEKIINEFNGMPVNLKELIVDRGLIKPKNLYKAVAIQHKTEFIDLSEMKIDDALFSQFDINIVRRYNFIPYKKEGDKLIILMDDPSDVERIEEIESIIGIPTISYVAVRSEIMRVINLVAETSLSESALFSETEETVAIKSLSEDDTDDKGDMEFLKTYSDATIVNTVNSILIKAIRKKASDIHIEIYPEEMKVKFRIDGALFNVKKIDPKSRNFIVSRIKNMANLDISEKRVPQDGRFKAYIDDRNIDFRVSVLPSIFGETVVIRILDQNAVGLDLEKLGFPPEDMLKFKKNIFKPYGMILSAGPTGSGKTTTLYSAIKAIKTPEDKLITIEDPVEYQIPDIVQVNVNEKKGLTFASGLRSIVRQDPDKIMIGEIRDTETAAIAVNAALTGHLVLSTIHANNVIDAIARLTNMGVEPYQFAASFNLIISQRLIRKICSNCKEEYVPDKETMALISDFEKYCGGRKLYRGKGCRYCHNTGYQGRTGIYETLALSDEIKSLILKKASPLEIKSQAISEGMKTLRQAAWAKVIEGMTTIEEINRVTFED